jgi:transposase
MTLPALTPEQRAEALQKAAATRAKRSAAIAEVRKGAVTIADVLDDQESPLRRAFVRQVLLAIPGIGAAKAAAIMAAARIPAKRRISGLGDNQVRLLKAQFEPAAA